LGAGIVAYGAWLKPEKTVSGGKNRKSSRKGKNVIRRH